jgi:hypothetical protein
MEASRLKMTSTPAAGAAVGGFAFQPAARATVFDATAVPAM